MRKLLCLMLMMLCCALPALAEDVCVVADASSANHLATGCPYLRVECPLTGESRVVLSVRDPWGELIYQRDYGTCSGHFRSRDIHLPLEGDTCDYTVTLAAGNTEYAFTVTREQAMLTDTAVYASGLSLKELGGSSRKYAVVLDLDAMNRSTAVMPLLSGGMQVGEAYFTVQDGKLTVSAALTAEGCIDKSNVYVALDALTAQTLGSNRFTGVKTRMDRPVDCGNAPYAAVMLQLTITYDPATAQDVGAGSLSIQEMRDNWNMMLITTANEAVG